MKRALHLMLAVAVAGTMSLSAFAQPDYRYKSAEDAARLDTPQQAPAEPVTPPPPLPPAAATPPPPPARCVTCGTIDFIRTTERAGEGSAVGLIAGGLLGGLLGHQVGQGRGNTAATILGAAGGAYAGHQVEKNVKKTLFYEVSVKMEDGTLRTVGYDFEPGFRTGDKVRFIDGRLTRD